MIIVVLLHKVNNGKEYHATHYILDFIFRERILMGKQILIDLLNFAYRL